MSRRTSSVSGGAMGLEWAVPKDTKLKYTQAFNQHDRQRQGFLTGVQARGLLVQTGLAHDMLAQGESSSRSSIVAFSCSLLN